MNKVLFKFSLLFLVSTLIYFFILSKGIYILSNDKMYKKIFSTTHSSMIIGTSKAERLNAELLNQKINSNQMLFTNVYNYAFSLGASPFGPAYYNSIVTKLNNEPAANNKVFFIAIDPWSVSTKKVNYDNSENYREANSYISFNPNQFLASYKYFHKHYTQSYYSLFLGNSENKTKKVKSRPTKEHVEKHLKSKILGYKNDHLMADSISPIRYEYFEKLIDTLNTVGEVYIVRLPVSKEMIDLEKKYAPNFIHKIKKTAESHHASLLDFYPFAGQFLSTDGNHLFNEDADRVSLILGEIARLKAENKFQLNEANLLIEFMDMNADKYIYSK